MNDIEKWTKFMGFAFNPYKQLDFIYNKNADNYRMHKFIQGTHIAPFSIASGIKVAKMEDEEQLRYVADFARNTGVNTSDWKYPIRMGYYGNAGGLGSAYGQITPAIMNLYKKATYKPKDVKIYNNKYIHNHGAYYRYGDFNNYQYR